MDDELWTNLRNLLGNVVCSGFQELVLRVFQLGLKIPTDEGNHQHLGLIKNKLDGNFGSLIHTHHW